MGNGDANGISILESEYEVLYCVRDLIKLYERQQLAIYGRVSKHLEDTLRDTEKRLAEIESELESL